MKKSNAEAGVEPATGSLWDSHPTVGYPRSSPSQRRELVRFFAKSEDVINCKIQNLSEELWISKIILIVP